MYAERSIAVVIPALNEEKFIYKVISSVPSFVDSVIVVDDNSSDQTSAIVKDFKDRDVVLIKHPARRGVGGAIASGYKAGLDIGADILVVMAGDGQTDPEDMPALLEPIIKKEADYVKGNRFSDPCVFKVMPKLRLAGNIILTLITRFASGYWHIVDSQCGYTAISREALSGIDLRRLYKKYGFLNDLLVKLNLNGAKVKDAAVRPIYGEEKSKLKILSCAPRIAALLARSYLRRIFLKYIIPVCGINMRKGPLRLQFYPPKVLKILDFLTVQYYTMFNE